MFENRLKGFEECFLRLLDSLIDLLFGRSSRRAFNRLPVYPAVIDKFLGESKQLIPDVDDIETRNLGQTVECGFNTVLVAIDKALIQIVA